MLDSQIFPGIIMVGVVPIFYHIPITAELIQCVETGRYSPEPTWVQRCVPPVPDQAAYLEDGLVPLANRHIVMQCFEAFKAFIVSLAECSQLAAINLSYHPECMIHVTCNLLRIHDTVRLALLAWN